MDTTIFTNFLFITLSIFIICLTIGFVFLVWYLILILESMHRFFNIIKKESEKISADVEYVRGKFKNGGLIFASLIAYALSLFKKNKKSH